MISSATSALAANLATKFFGGIREEIVWRVDGDSQEGAHYWSYVAVDKQKFSSFKKALDDGDIRVQDYGKILAWGVGQTPPGDIKTHIKQHYGLDIEG